MRSIKCLLLGSAAGLCAVASAQAADLPVKAKPVEYVKVCSLYGAGFFYVPGTETCLKLGMYLRSDHQYGGGPTTYFFAGPSGQQTRTSQNEFNYRARINLTTDWRTQTDYGVLRGYAAIIAQQTTGDGVAAGTAGGTGNAGILRAFIQFAGFTFGHAVSYYDFFNGADYGYLPSIWIGGTGVNGTDLIGYTAQLGNGFSASIDVEDGGSAGTVTGNGRPKAILNGSQIGALALGAATLNNLGQNAPDIAANLRVDQAWGSAQIAGALHQASGGYWNSTTPGAYSSGAFATNFGHPSEAWGGAGMVGFKINNFIMPKDVFEFQADYGVGAINYIANIYQAVAFFGRGNQLGVGWAVDGVFSNQGNVQLTTAWGFAAAFQHYWSPQWRTSVVGGYTAYRYNTTAATTICGTAPGNPNPANSAFGTLAFSNCSPNYSLASVSTRTAFNPHPTVEIGLDLIWARIYSANKGFVSIPQTGARPASSVVGLYAVADQNVYTGVLRVQKNVLP